MADTFTFNGVPLIRYGLTGILLVFLTGMTFVDTKGQVDTSIGAVATASLPTFIGERFTPSAPSFVDSITQPSEEPSLMERVSNIESPLPDFTKPVFGGNKKKKKTRKSR